MTPEQYKRIFDIGQVLGIAITGLVLLAFLSPPVSASLLITQGSRVYMNETVDLSQAASWPSYALAWCKYSYCISPDQVVDLTVIGHMENYYIDPDVFKYGTWYRWDGKFNRGENQIAFVINPGTRPEPKPTLASNNTTTGSPVEILNPLGPFAYLIASGDAPSISVNLDRLDSCRLWIFGNTNKAYGVPMIYKNGTYHYQFSSADTLAMGVGSYDGYIQCNGGNGWQDISYAKENLTTPYKSVADVHLTDLTPYIVKQRFDGLVKTIPNFDDKLYPISISVTVASTTITDVTQDEKSLYLAGTTSWEDGSIITLKLDPDNYVLPQEIRTHTWNVPASGSIDTYRKFAIAVPLDKMQLYIGSHQIVASVAKNGYMSDSYYDFKISDIYVMPTPTPKIVRMIYGKDYESIPVKVTQTPTPEPTIPPTSDVTRTAKPVVNATSVPTTTVPTEIPTTSPTIPTIPVELPIALAGVGIAIAMRRNI
jgi:hypothetical protein